MITITYNGNKSNLIDAVSKANALLGKQQFYDDIKSHPAFDMANTTPAIIAGLMQNSAIAMRVVPYLSLKRYVYGYDDPNNPDLIHINIFRNDWSIGGLVNTMIHEAVHAVDNESAEYTFGHGDNSSEGKENTAPYWIGNHAENLIEGGGSVAVSMIHDDLPENIA